jgi:hypothetical protein
MADPPLGGPVSQVDDVSRWSASSHLRKRPQRYPARWHDIVGDDPSSKPSTTEVKANDRAHNR